MNDHLQVLLKNCQNVHRKHKGGQVSFPVTATAGDDKKILWGLTTHFSKDPDSQSSTAGLRQHCTGSSALQQLKTF